MYPNIFFIQWIVILTIWGLLELDSREVYFILLLLQYLSKPFNLSTRVSVTVLFIQRKIWTKLRMLTANYKQALAKQGQGYFEEWIRRTPWILQNSRITELGALKKICIKIEKELWAWVGGWDGPWRSRKITKTLWIQLINKGRMGAFVAANRCSKIAKMDFIKEKWANKKLPPINSSRESPLKSQIKPITFNTKTNSKLNIHINMKFNVNKPNITRFSIMWSIKSKSPYTSLTRSKLPNNKIPMFVKAAIFT